MVSLHRTLKHRSCFSGLYAMKKTNGEEDYMRRQTAVMMLVWIMVGIGCATYLPGNPDHDWLRGKWLTHRTSGWTTELDLRVVDGNIVVGTNIQTAPDGRRGTGDVRGGVEGERINF